MEIFEREDYQRMLTNEGDKKNTCPRCGGNLILDRDIDGYNKTCIQCSFRIQLAGFYRPEVRNSQTRLSDRS
jgi:hypothetical protein